MVASREELRLDHGFPPTPSFAQGRSQSLRRPYLNQGMMAAPTDQRRDISHNRFGNGTSIHQGNIQNYFGVPHPPALAEITTVPLPGPHFLVPFPKNKRFVGRKAILGRLKDSLRDDDRPRFMAIVGLGGVGKTQVVLQVAHYIKNQPDWSVFWLSALSMAAFEQACTEMVEKVRILCSRTEDAKHMVKAYLESTASGRWLLIVDNADDLAITMGPGVYTSLPKSGNGCILFTTRVMEVAQAVAEDDTEELEEMSEDEAKAFMQNLLPESQAEDEMMTELLLRLTYLPLAISQAAAYMKRNKTPVSRYLSLLRDVNKEAIGLLSREFPDRTRYPESRHAVVSTWLISFEQIRKNDETAAGLLSLLSQIEPRAIPQSMLPRVRSEESLINAIGTLCGYAFLYRRDDGETLDMHSLVQFAAREWVNRSGDADRVKRQLIVHLAAMFRSDDWADREMWRNYMPHVQKAIQITEEGEMGGGECELGYWTGRCLQVEGRIAEAVEMLQQVVKVREMTLAENHHSRLASQHALAAAYRANGQVKRAVELLEHVVEVRKITLAGNHPDRLASQHALARAYQADGQVEEAVELLEPVVKVQKKTLAEHHPDRLASQYALATAYKANGQVKEAVELLAHVVKVRETTLAEDHPDRLASQHALALAYQANGQVKQAVELLAHVVKVRETTLAENHPSRLASQHELAVAYRADGQVREAVELLQHVVEVHKMTLAETHPDRLASQHALAGAYRANGQVKEAVGLLEHVVKVRGATLAENHPSRLASQHALAIAYRANGEVKEAVKLLEHVVKVREMMMSENHPSRLASQHELAIAYHANRQATEAVELLERVVFIKSQIMAPAHPSRQISEGLLAQLRRLY